MFGLAILFLFNIIMGIVGYLKYRGGEGDLLALFLVVINIFGLIACLLAPKE